MFAFIIIIILAAVVGATAVYFYLIPKVQTAITLDLETQNQNKELKAELLQLTQQLTELQTKKELILQGIDEWREQSEKEQKRAEEAANAIFEKSYELANEKMDAAAKKMSAAYEEAKREAEQEYLTLLSAQAEMWDYRLQNVNKEIESAESRLADLTSKVQAAIEAAKRQEQIASEQDFYKLNLSTIDIEEIQKLRQVTVLLRDSEPLNKVIWKVYYEKPYTDLIGRVVGTGNHTGIYKITNIENQKCYVGQAANIAERWRQHIKRGIGAEAPTRNKLYPAMLEHGVENFTFEVVEECSREMLNEREDYWQEYFGAREFGYSIK